MTALNDQIRRLHIKPGVYYYALPTYKQAKQVIWDELINKHAPKELISKKNDSELAIYWKNGSIQRFIGCEDIDKHRGSNPIDVVLDEYSEMKEEIWTAIFQPVLRENKGTATFIFTPKGQNHAWRLLQYAKQHEDNWFWQVSPASETKAIDEQELIEAQKETPESLYKQEYECEFNEGAGQFFRRIDENKAVTFDAPEYGHHYQIGIDLAKYQDWTVLTPFNLTTFQAGVPERFNQVDWNLQKSKIESFARRYNNARIVIDSTGVGDPITEDLSRIGLAVEPFKFTQTTREQLLNNLAVKLEQNLIKIPNVQWLIDELKSMRYEWNPTTRKTSVKVPDSLHDDGIMSLALAVWNTTVPVYSDDHEDQNYSLYTADYS